MEKHKAVFGIYRTREEVERAVEILKNDGFQTDDISVLLPDEHGSQEFAHVKNTKAPEGAAAGAGTGLIVGGTLGWLAGIGAIVIPGVGALLAAGPIVATLAGAGLIGTIGGLSGALIGLGIPEYEAKRYEGYIKNGGLLLSIHVGTGEFAARARQTLEATNAEDIAVTGEVQNADIHHNHRGRPDLKERNSPFRL